MDAKSNHICQIEWFWKMKFPWTTKSYILKRKISIDLVKSLLVTSFIFKIGWSIAFGSSLTYLYHLQFQRFCWFTSFWKIWHCVKIGFPMNSEEYLFFENLFLEHKDQLDHAPLVKLFLIIVKQAFSLNDWLIKCLN